MAQAEAVAATEEVEMPNPAGSNQFQREQPYGAVKRLKELKRQAPMSGAPTPGANAPQRAQRKAVRGSQPQGVNVPPPGAPQPPTGMPFATRQAALWRELRAEMPDDLLVTYYADRAVRDAGTL